jgi:hypothetical protein
MEGSLRRSDAAGLIVKLKIGDLDMVNFLEGVGVYPDKVTDLGGGKGGASPCRSASELAAGKIQTPWCIPDAKHAAFDKTADAACKAGKQCADAIAARKAKEPGIDEKAMKAICVEAKHIDASGKALESACAIADAWHFAGTFDTEYKPNFNNARIGK